MTNQDSGIGRSDVMYPAVLSNGDASNAMVPAQPYPAMPMPGFGGAGPRGPEIVTGSINQTWFLNSLRRKWLPALLLGSLASLCMFGFLWWLFPESSSVTAYLRVKAVEPETLFDQKKVINPKEYEIFQQTQLALFKSHFVLNAALNRSEISQLDAVVKEQPYELKWLSDEIRVSFPGEGEIMEVRFDGEEDPEEIMKIVDAVIESYTFEVIHKERTRSSETRESMEKLHKQLKEELEEKHDRYLTLSKELDSSTGATESAVLSMLASDVRMIQQQIIEKKQELIDLEVTKQLAAQNANSPTALEAAIQEQLDQDPMFQNFQQEEYAYTQQLMQLQAITKGNRKSPELKRLQSQLSSLRSQIQEYRITKTAELRDRLKNAPNEMLQSVMMEYMLRRQSVGNDIAELEAKYEDKMAEVERKGQTSGKLAILNTEIEQLSEVAQTMELKIRGWSLDEKAGQDRVRILQKATPQEKINTIERYTIVTIGALTAFCVTCFGIALLEFQRRRLNGPTDIDEGLGIRVLGVLPSVSSRKAMVPGSPIAAQLSESIDSVRAALMHDSTFQARQVVLITSPASMEGCTTVASHLALSLTRAGRRTLLIDGDLREPALHKLFGMPLEDGVSEVLRSDIDVTDAIRPTSTEGLWLMTAGQCDMGAIHALATEQLQPIFEKLRAEFDFVIIDGAPLLGMSDSISIGQHVDGAILTLLRDQTEIRKVLQSSELLKAMGIRLFGAVVNGVRQKADRRVARLHRSAARPPRPQLPEKAETPAKAQQPVAARTPAAPQQPEVSDELEIDVSDIEEIDVKDFEL